jgi:hypothetical protein
MAQNPVNDPAQAQNQGLPAGSKLDSEQVNAGTGSPMNRKPSPKGQKVQSLNIHRNPYADSKRKR